MVRDVTRIPLILLGVAILAGIAAEVLGVLQGPTFDLTSILGAVVIVCAALGISYLVLFGNWADEDQPPT